MRDRDVTHTALTHHLHHPREQPCALDPRKISTSPRRRKARFTGAPGPKLSDLLS
jgi:hypothetical protein